MISPPDKRRPAMPSKSRQAAKRSLIVMGLVIVGVTAAVVSPKWLFQIELGVLGWAVYWEYVSLATKTLRMETVLTIITVGGGAAVSAAAASGEPEVYIGVLAGTLLLLLVADLCFSRNDMNASGSGLSLATVGFVFCLAPVFYAVKVRSGEDGTAVLIFISALVCFRDLAANAAGRFVAGRVILAPSLNPRKNLEAAAVAAALTLGLAATLQMIFEDSLPFGLWTATGLAVISGIAGVVGDLVESLLKRRARTSDSSGLFGSQGGLLDSLDSLLFSLPFLYWALLATGIS